MTALNRRQRTLALFFVFSLTFALTSLLLIAALQSYQHRQAPVDKPTHQLTPRKAY